MFLVRGEKCTVLAQHDDYCLQITAQLHSFLTLSHANDQLFPPQFSSFAHNKIKMFVF